MARVSEPVARKGWSREGLTTLTALLERAVQKWPDRIFLDFTGDKRTYGEVDRASTRMARGLAQLGVAPGDCVCVMMDNSVDMAVCWFAVSKLGAIFVPFNTTYKGTYLQHQLRDIAGRIMVAETHYLDMIRDVYEDTLALELVVYRGPRSDKPMPLPMMALEDLSAVSDEPISYDVKPEDPALVHYTSGTTGPSKGGVLSHAYFSNYSLQNGQCAGLTGEDVLWTPLPMFHGSALLQIGAAMCVGATASVYPHFSVSKFWPEMERSGATVVALLSIMIALIPGAPDSEASRRCYGQIRVVRGAPFSAALKTQWKERFGVKYALGAGYGSTEACQVTIAEYTDTGLPEDCAGRRYPDFDVRVIDDEGNECPPNVAGEIIWRPLRPGVMFSGYWRRPEATLAIFNDLWYRSGDIGTFDENGIFYFLDRKKDYLRKGGENISSFEVENTFMTHPAVSEVAAHAVPSDLAEDELKVTVVCGDGKQVSATDLYAWSLDRLPKFAVPRYIEFRTELPRTANGKLQKHILREQGVTSYTWDSKARRA